MAPSVTADEVCPGCVCLGITVTSATAMSNSLNE